MIYVVEDDDAVRISFEVMLESKGFDVETFDTGQAVLERIKTRAPSVLLLDMQLPDMNGNAVIEALSNLGYDVPVVVMTGGASPRTKQRVLGLGAVAVFDKPPPNEQLIETIKKYI